MTNTTQEVTVEKSEEVATIMTMRPAATGASWEAPAMLSSSLMAAIAEEENGINTENELLVNAARAVKRVRFRAASKIIADTDTDITNATAATTTQMNGEYQASDHHDVVDDDVRGRVCYTTSNITNTATKEKNETTLVNEENSHVFVGVVTTTSAAADDKDYVGNVGEEEDGTYKTSRLATLPQSEHDIILEQQDQGTNALIPTIRLFLVETWNWLYYFLVTIIFLNLVHFADRRSGDSVVGEELPSVEVDGSAEQGNDSEESATGNQFIVNDDVEEDFSGEKNKNLGISKDQCDSAFFEETDSEKSTKMSPNTCSIQNQQEVVEEAQEAIVAVVSNEKPATPQPNNNEEEAATETSAAEIQQQKQPEITVILAGETVDDESDENGGEEEVMETLRRDSVDSYTSSDGNLGDTEDGSESKGNESTDPVATTISTKEIAQKIVSQVENMFSDEHLAKDGFLLKHVRRRSDGFVSLKLVAGLRKVKQISREFPVVLNALKDSSKLEINAEGTKVRRVEPLTPFLKSVQIKSKDKETKQPRDKDAGSSNDENQQPTVTIQNIGSNNNKSASKAGNKENDNGANKRGQNRRNSTQAQNNANNNGNQSRRNSNAHNNHHVNRKSSNASTTSSNGSRHNSFSKAPPTSSQQHPADLLRNVYTMTAYSSGEECQSPQSGRRRGGSLPIAALQRQGGSAYLSPNSSPPNGAGPFFTIGPNGGARPKSNSYCEGAGPSTMSPWLQRRKASASSRLSQGELIISGVIRQPRGPDGTKGFASGYRAMILQERLQQNNSAVSA